MKRFINLTDNKNIIVKIAILVLIMLIYISFALWSDKAAINAAKEVQFIVERTEEVAVSDGATLSEIVKTKKAILTGMYLHVDLISNNPEFQEMLSDGYVTLTANFSTESWQESATATYYEADNTLAVYFPFEQKHSVKNGTYINVVLQVDKVEDNHDLLLHLGSHKRVGKAVIDGEEYDSGIGFGYCNLPADYLAKVYRALAVFLGLGIIITYCLYFIFDVKRLEILFIVMALFLAPVYLLGFPEEETPDEIRHLATVWAITDKWMGMEPNGVEMYQTEYLSFSELQLKYNRKSLNQYIENILHAPDKVQKDEESFLSGYDTIQTKSYQYFPSAIATLIGRKLNIGVTRTLLLGACASFLFFLICFAYAIYKIPIGKELLMVIGLLPMTMQQVTSYSYDVFIISASVVITALGLKLGLTEKRTWKEILILMVLCALIAPLKYGTYITVVAICMIPLMRLRKEKPVIFKACIGVAIAFALFFVISRLVGYANVDTNVVGFTGKQGYTFGGLIKNPVVLLKIFWATFYSKFDFYLNGIIGNSLGNFSVNLPYFVVYAFMVLLFITAMYQEGEEIVLTTAQRVLMFALGAVCVAFANVGMLFAWTSADTFVIDGVQGRYFIPVTAMLFLALRGKKISVKPELARTATFVPILVQMFIMYTIFGYRG